MIITITDDFNLKKIADSGQCFRFNEVTGTGTGDEGASCRRYSVAAGSRHVFVKELGQNRYDFDCSEDEFETFWKRYFDLDLSYSEIRGRIDQKKDPYLFSASQYGKGIRILGILARAAVILVHVAFGLIILLDRHFVTGGHIAVACHHMCYCGAPRGLHLGDFGFLNLGCSIIVDVIIVLSMDKGASTECQHSHQSKKFVFHKRYV